MFFEHESREFNERLQWQRRVAPWCDRMARNLTQNPQNYLSKNLPRISRILRDALRISCRKLWRKIRLQSWWKLTLGWNYHWFCETIKGITWKKPCKTNNYRICIFQIWHHLLPVIPRLHYADIDRNDIKKTIAWTQKSKSIYVLRLLWYLRRW